MARRGSVTEIGKEIHFQEDGNFVAAAEKPKTDEEIAADLKASHDARDAKLLKAGYPSKYGTEEVVAWIRNRVFPGAKITPKGFVCSNVIGAVVKGKVTGLDLIKFADKLVKGLPDGPWKACVERPEHTQLDANTNCVSKSSADVTMSRTWAIEELLTQWLVDRGHRSALSPGVSEARQAASGAAEKTLGRRRKSVETLISKLPEIELPAAPRRGSVVELLQQQEFEIQKATGAGKETPLSIVLSHIKEHFGKPQFDIAPDDCVSIAAQALLLKEQQAFLVKAKGKPKRGKPKAGVPKDFYDSCDEEAPPDLSPELEKLMNTAQYMPHVATITDAQHLHFVDVEHPFDNLLTSLGLPYKYNAVLEKKGYTTESEVKGTSIKALMALGIEEDDANVLTGKKKKAETVAPSPLFRSSHHSPTPPPSDDESSDGFGDASEDEELGHDLTEVERLVEHLNLGDPRSLDWQNLRENGITKTDQLKMLKPLDLIKMHVPQKGIFVMRVHIEEEEKVAAKVAKMKAVQMRNARVTTGRRASYKAEIEAEVNDYMKVKVAGSKYITTVFGEEGGEQAAVADTTGDTTGDAAPKEEPLDDAAIEAMLGPDLTAGM